MSLPVSDAVLQRITDALFLLKTPKPGLLSKPTNTAAFVPRLAPVFSDSRFKDIGIGVVDFTADVMHPRIALLNENVPWRMGSTGKIAILLAAVQLRDDVRKAKIILFAAGLELPPDEYDELFRIIWLRSSESWIKNIGARQGNPPRISTIFDLAGIPNFRGADTLLDKPKLQRMASAHVHWSQVPDLTFWELLALTGAWSDNVAATACVSEIGIAYMTAVQRAYGLFDPINGMHMRLGSGYSGVNTRTPVTRGMPRPTYRPLGRVERNFVQDVHQSDPNHGHDSTQPGSAAALTAYMIALMQNQLPDIFGCNTIRELLGDETGDLAPGRPPPNTATSLILIGVRQAGVPVVKAHTKLGILVNIGRCEFAYVEAGGLKYAVLAIGVWPKSVNPPIFLFDLPLHFAGELDANRHVSAGLNAQFRVNHEPSFDADARVVVNQAHRNWTIRDKDRDREFTIHREPAVLKVFRNKFAAWEQGWALGKAIHEAL